MSTGSGLLLLLSLIVACEQQPPGAIEHGDPLHAQAISLPPPQPVLLPRDQGVSPAESGLHVASPPLSPGIFPCSQCHTPNASVQDGSPVFPHDVHLALDLECFDCHDSGRGPDEPQIPDAEFCQNCHEDPDDDFPGAIEYFAALPRRDGAYVIPDRWQTHDVIVNHATHGAAEVDCFACHGEPQDGSFVKPSPDDLMQRCLDCHEQRQIAADCQTCHRELREDMHSGIVLEHTGDQRGCFTCHNPDDRDTLRLADGTQVSFEESYLLCGQCHGPKLSDWRQGLHGKRTGMWNGQHLYLLCVHCHQDPHRPQFPPMRPVPPPIRPEDIR